MKILFGIPDITHRELVNLEINGIKEIIPDCNTIHYGPVHSRRGIINKIIFTIINALSIKKALKRKKYNLLFLNTTFDFNGVLRDSITIFILKPVKTKVFLKFHGCDPDLLDNDRWYKKRLANWLLDNVHGVGILSTEEEKTFIKKGFPLEKIFIVKNPVNPFVYEKDCNSKIRWGLSEKIFTFIFCARFIQFKGLMDVLEAIKIVKTKFQNIHLFCIGDGPEMTKAQLFVNNYDLNSTVTFTGFITESETRYYYANADSLIFPSSHEGFPMAVFQSLAAGITIIATRIAAPADYLTEPDNVLWVEFNNPIQIAESMTKLLTDNSLVNSMKSNNVIKAHQFTADKNASEYVCIFKKIIKE